MKLRVHRLAAGLMAALLALSVASATHTQQQLDLAALEQVAIDDLKQTGTPGAAVAIVRGDSVLMTRGYGVANVETGEPVKPEMLFRLGSTTKMLTATAVNVLAEEGRLKLESPIGAYIQGINSALGRVTAQQLLTHTAGIRDEAPMFGLHDDGALGAGIRAMGEDFLFAVPGDVFSYSNPGYWMAGYLAESVAGKPYADVMDDRVFRPLGMARTTLRPTLAMTYPLAQGHAPNAQRTAEVIRPAANNAATWPAGSVYSNVNDLARFVTAVLNEGRLEGRQALPAAVVKRITTGHVDSPGRDMPRYGHGITVRTLRGVKLWEHGGSRSGYGSLIWMAPEQKVGVIVLANRTGASLTRTASRALEMLVPLAPTEPAPNRQALTLSAAEMAELAGAYSQTSKPDIELFVKDGQLFMRTAAGALPVTKVASNRLAVQRQGASAPQELVVTRGRDGKTLYLHQGTRALRKLPPATT